MQWALTLRYQGLGVTIVLASRTTFTMMIRNIIFPVFCSMPEVPHPTAYMQETYIVCSRKMLNCLKVITKQLSDSEQPYQSFRKLPEAHEQAQWKTICFPGALSGTFRIYSTLLKLRNRIQEYSTEYEVVFRMLYNLSFKLVQFGSYCDYNTRHEEHSRAPGARLSRSENI
jgi:hypothetical protein